MTTETVRASIRKIPYLGKLVAAKKPDSFITGRGGVRIRDLSTNQNSCGMVVHRVLPCGVNVRYEALVKEYVGVLQAPYIAESISKRIPDLDAAKNGEITLPYHLSYVWRIAPEGDNGIDFVFDSFSQHLPERNRPKFEGGRQYPHAVWAVSDSIGGGSAITFAELSPNLQMRVAKNLYEDVVGGFRRTDAEKLVMAQKLFAQAEALETAILDSETFLVAHLLY